MECVLRKFGSYENFEEVTGGSVLPKSQVWAAVRKYLQKEGCVGEVRRQNQLFLRQQTRVAGTAQVLLMRSTICSVKASQEVMRPHSDTGAAKWNSAHHSSHYLHLRLSSCGRSVQ